MVVSNHSSIPFSGPVGRQALEARLSSPLNLSSRAGSSWTPTSSSFLGNRIMGRIEDTSTRAIPRSSTSDNILSPIYPLSDKLTRSTPQLLPRSTTVGSILGEAEMPLSMAQTPRSTPRQADYSYYSDDTTQQYTPTSVQGQTMPYSSDYTTQDAMQRQGNYSYPQNMVYGVPQSASSDPYEQAYPPRQPAAAAIEVLSNQFGVSPYYGDASPHGAANVSPQQAQASYPNLSYAGRPGAPAYGAQMPMSGEENQQFMYQGPSEGGDPEHAMDAAHNQYQDALRSCFQNVRDGRMATAGAELVEITEWLLSNAQDLGLVTDQPELSKDRTKLWTEFNLCWLTAMQKQKELAMEQRSTGQPRDLIAEADLEKMGGELLRHCDNMEKHGLVDYQMGVWEEQILDAIQECLDVVQNKESGSAADDER